MPPEPENSRTPSDTERLDWLEQIIGHDEMRIAWQDDYNKIQLVAQGWCFVGRDLRQAIDRFLLNYSPPAKKG